MSEKIGKHQICRCKALSKKYSTDEVLKNNFRYKNFSNKIFDELKNYSPQFATK